MRDIEIGYLELYKRVDNICRDTLHGEHYYNNKGEEIYGVSAYIRVMETEYAAARYGVPDWDGQLGQLKELRHIRNLISHENADSGCTEAHLKALELFRRQLLSQQDPLALAYRLQRQRAAQHPRQTPAQPAAARYSQPYAVRFPQPQQKARRQTEREQRSSRVMWGVCATVLLLLVFLVVFLKFYLL